MQIFTTVMLTLQIFISSKPVHLLELLPPQEGLVDKKRHRLLSVLLKQLPVLLLGFAHH